MSKYLHIVAVCGLLLLSACSKDDGGEMQHLSIVSADGNTTRYEFVVELADTIEKSYRGLMGRFYLPEKSGMLFDVNVIPKDMPIAFWMKDTPISLDMIFADENGVIFYIYEQARPNDTTAIMSPTRPAAVLEINGGQVERFGIKLGDVMHHKLFNN